MAEPRFAPVPRMNSMIGSAAYTWEDLGQFMSQTGTAAEQAQNLEQRAEHNQVIKKEKLPSKFSALKITDFNTLKELDGHYNFE